MSIRLEKSGELYFIRGNPKEPEPPMPKRSAGVGLWLALTVLVGGVLFIGPHSLSMADVSHALKALLSTVH